MVIKGETDMLETFNVLRIDEPDFGCEGRPDGMAVKDNVLLKSNYTGEEMTVREKDARPLPRSLRQRLRRHLRQNVHGGQ